MRKIVAIIVPPMNLLGVNPLKEDTLLGCYIRILLACVALLYTLCSTILLLYHLGGDLLHNLVVVMPYASYSIMFMAILISAQMCKSSVRYVLSGVDNRVFQYPDELDFRVEYGGYLSEVKSTRVYLLVILFEMSGFVIAWLSPLTVYLLIGTLELHLYPQWVPWSLESTFDKIVAYSLQFPPFFVVFVIRNFTQLYFVFILVEFLRQFKKLQYAIETLDERSRRKVILTQMGRHMRKNNENRYDNEEYDILFRLNLTACIRHHQKIILMFKKFEIFYNLEYSLELFLVSYSFTFLLFGLVEKNDPIYFLNLTAAAWAMISNIFSRCFMGEQFSEMNLKIQNALFYNLNWYDQSAENKKLISIFHGATRQSLVLKGFGIFPASYYVFSHLIRSSYSYFNLLRASI